MRATSDTYANEVRTNKPFSESNDSACCTLACILADPLQPNQAAGRTSWPSVVGTGHGVLLLRQRLFGAHLELVEDETLE